MYSCPQCHSTFTRNTPYHMFCSYRCKDLYNKGSTWEGYLKSLLKNNSKKRKKLSAGILLKKYMLQGGKCAITGVQLTKIVGQGPISTNASIDRIQAGGEYVDDNIRLVCNFVNSWRGNITDEELVWWCEKVIEGSKCQRKNGIIKKSIQNITAAVSKKLDALLEAVRDIRWKRQVR